jgi:hypothetical protein
VDRYVDHLDNAANDAGKAKSRPDDEDGRAGHRVIKVSTRGYGGALGGTRTPNLLIRSQMLYPLSYERRC